MKQDDPKKRMHPANVVISIIALAVVIVAGYYLTAYFLRNKQYEQTNDAQVEAYINPVSARASGFIQKILFEENQFVHQGDTLVILDDREYSNKVQEGEVALQDVLAQLTVLNASVNALATSTSVNKDQIDAAQARLWQQQQDIKRYENLVKEEAATGQEYEQVKARYDVAASEYSASQNTLRTTYSRIEELKSRHALLEVDLKRKQTQLALAKISLSYTAIVAPYTGRLGRKVIQEGQQIQAGQPLVTIVNENLKWVTANFKETQVGEMYNGQPVELVLDAFPGKIYHGQIASISGTTGAKFSLLPPDNATGNFVKITQRIPVKILFTDTALAAVRIGMNVNVAVKKQ